MMNNRKELSMNELENVNGAGLLDWVVVHVATPVVRTLDYVKNNSDGLVKKTVEVIQNNL